MADAAAQVGEPAAESRMAALDGAGSHPGSEARGAAGEAGDGAHLQEWDEAEDGEGRQGGEQEDPSR